MWVINWILMPLILALLLLMVVWKLSILIMAGLAIIIAFWSFCAIVKIQSRKES